MHTNMSDEKKARTYPIDAARAQLGYKLQDHMLSINNAITTCIEKAAENIDVGEAIDGTMTGLNE